MTAIVTKRDLAEIDSILKAERESDWYARCDRCWFPLASNRSEGCVPFDCASRSRARMNSPVAQARLERRRRMVDLLDLLASAHRPVERIDLGEGQ